jgi:hypothetical protein
MNLLPLDEVRSRLRITGQVHLGAQSIPVERIVGSVDRSADFARDFTPQRSLSRARLRRLRDAFPTGDLPPIEVYEAGGAYFVSDGHHRVALARQTGADFVDALVTRLETNYELPPDVDVAALVHTHAHRRLFEESGLGKARPDAVIEFALPRGYPELLEAIQAHGWVMAQARGTLPAPEEVAADFHDTVFVPGVEAVRRHRLDRAFPVKTEADLFLWLYERRRDLQVADASATFDDAAEFALREGVGRRLRRELGRAVARPLRHRRPAR